MKGNVMEQKRVKIFFAGGRKLGNEVLDWMCNQKWIDIVAVCPIPIEADGVYGIEIRRTEQKYHLKEILMDEATNIDADLGLSVNYNRIIKPVVFNSFIKGFFNVHHSYNMRLRGRHIATHAILESRKDNIFYHGTSLHKIEEKLDAGQIVASYSCPIEYDDTAYTLFNKCDKLALKMIQDWLPRIAFEKIMTYTAPNQLVHEYRASDLPDRCMNSFFQQSDDKSVRDFIRAFDFPGNEPTFLLDGTIKKHFVLYPRDEFVFPYEIKGNTFFSDVQSEL